MARKVCESVEALHSPRDPAPQDARGDPNDLKQGMSVGRDGCGLRAVAVVPNCCWRGRRGRSRPAPAHVGVSPHRIPTSRSRPCRGRSLARSGTAAMGARDLKRQAGSQLHCGCTGGVGGFGLWVGHLARATPQGFMIGIDLPASAESNDGNHDPITFLFASTFKLQNA